MREILFRAKDEASNKWVYGYYVHLPSAAGSVHIMQVPAGNPDESNTAYYIIPETVGQFTGLTDKNGKKIFEGDIIHYIDDYDDFDGFTRTVDEKAIILWDKDYCGFACKIIGDESEDVYSWLDFFVKPDLAVIGNIHDNPELFGGDVNDKQRKADKD